MRIRIISDLHIDINERFPFTLRDTEKVKERDDFAIVAGDVSGNVKLTARWMKENVKRGVFIVGNHDPAYNNLGWTIGKQKEYLHERFPLDADVTFMDESVGVMSKPIPGTNALVVGSTLYTDYLYADENRIAALEDGNKRRKEYGEDEITMEEANMASGARGLNDFRWGHVEDEFDDRGLSQRTVRPDDYKKWFNSTIAKIDEIARSNADKDIVVVTHHCPSPKCIAERYVSSGMNASYVSDLEGFILKHPNIKAWCCGHVHSVKITEIGDQGQLLVCNPRGYERDMESDGWNPNTFLDTDTWKVVQEPYANRRLDNARKKFRDEFMKYAPLFF